jgi:hypothetical protein
MNCEANPKGKDSEQSVGEILQNEKLQESRGAVQCHSAPQPDEDVAEFGPGGSVYGYKFDFVAAVGHKSKTPKNVSGQDLNTEGEQHSAKPGEPDVTSNDSEIHTETEDNRLEDPRSSKKARRGRSSLSPTRSLSEDSRLHLVSDPPVIPIAIPTARPPSRDSSSNRSATSYPKASLETTASVIASPEVEVVGSPSNNAAAPSHNAGNGTPEKPKVPPNKSKRPPPRKGDRQSPRLLEKNQNNTKVSATTVPSVEQSYFAPYVTEEESLQNSGEELCGSDEHEAITDEYQASKTSDQALGSVAREPNSDTETAEAVQPPIDATERPDTDATKRAGDIEFKQHKEMKSPSEIKAEILNIIFKGDKADKQGFVYIYKVQGSNGHVKIGKSRQEHGKRLKQWKSQCKLNPVPISDPNHKIFQYYGMVEKLAQMELSDRRKTYQCDVCRKGGSNSPKDARKEHEEWFEATEKHALEVIERWRGWLVQHQPYGLDGTLLGIWEWKRNKLSKTNTVDFKEWVILTQFDEYAYTWHKIDDYLKKQLQQPVLRSSLVINAAVAAVTLIWCESGAFLSLFFAIVILFVFLKYS